MTTLTEAIPQQTQKALDLVRPDVNVGNTERMIAGGIGGLLALQAFSKHGSLVLGLLGGGLIYRAATGYCPMYNALGINRAKKGPAEPEDYFQRGIHVECSTTIEKSPQELFAFWRNFENLPRIMSHLEEVRLGPDGKSHWKAKAPAGSSVEWDAEIINEQPNELIAWKSVDGADVDNAGSVRFLPGPGGRGTEVRVVVDYIPPAGRLGAIVASLFGQEPSQQITEDLRRFKQLMETGEIARCEGQAASPAQ